MLHTAICDDNQLHLESISKSFMENCSQYSPEIMLFSCGEELLNEVENGNYRPDILLLDIVLSDNDGISVAKRINELCPSCAIIYLTSYISYVSDVYETRHSYFILKSQFDQRISAAVSKAVSDINCMKKITFKEHSALVTLSAYEVLYMERSLKKTLIRHVSGKLYETYTKPDVLLKEIGNGLFVKCHQSFYVNMQAVTAMEADSFLLDNGLRVPISRSRKNETKAIFHAFVMNSIRFSRENMP